MTTVWGIIMSKQIEDYIDENLIDEARTVALEFVTFLRNNNIEFDGLF